MATLEEIMGIFGGRPDIAKLEKKMNLKGLVAALRYKKDASVRKDAARALGVDPQLFRTMFAIQRLAILDHRLAPITIRTGAVEILKHVSGLVDPGVFSGLQSALADPDPEVREGVAGAVGRLASSRMTASYEIARWQDSQLAQWMPELPALVERLKAGREVDLLIMALGDRQESVRRIAIEALQEIKDERSIQRLSELAEQDASSDIRERAKVAIARIRGTG